MSTRFSLLHISIFFSFVLGVIVYFPMSVHAAAQYTITDTGGDCTAFGVWNTASKTCTLTHNFNNIDGDLFSIIGSNITLNGNGYTLAATTSNSGIGIDLADTVNVTIKNISIHSFSIGVNIATTTLGAHIATTTFDGDITSIYNLGGINTTVMGSTFRNGNIALSIRNANGGTYFLNDIEDSMNTAISFFQSFNQLFYNNNFYTSKFDQYPGDPHSAFSKALPVGGNYWSVYHEDVGGCVDADNDLVCDTPYGTAYEGADEHPFIHPSGWDEYNWPPYISLNGVTSIYIVQGDTLSLPPVSATDREDGNISADVITTHPPIDTNMLGTTRIQYDVSDSQGKSADPVYRTVTVVPNDSFIPLFGVPLSEEHTYLDIVPPTMAGPDYYGNANYDNREGVHLIPEEDITGVQVIGLNVFIDTAATVLGKLTGDLHLIIAKGSMPPYPTTGALADVVIPKEELTLQDGGNGTPPDPVFVSLPSPVSLNAGEDYYIFLEREPHSTEPLDIGNYATYMNDNDDFPNITRIRCTIKGQCFPEAPEEMPFALYSEMPTTTSPTPTCCSSVLFLPGLSGSELYKPGLIGDDQLWLPNILIGTDDDVENLAFTPEGVSIRDDIYTREKSLIEKGYGIKPVYDGFPDFLDTLKENGIISDWGMVPYDWRLSIDDIISRGVLGNNDSSQGKDISYLTDPAGEPYIIAELQALTETSDTGKVIIIGHSMGGLVGKALIASLEDPANPYHDLYSKIEAFVLVGTPQLGTPDTLLPMLHGADNPLSGTLPGLSDASYRYSARYMPSAYALLPSARYMSTVPALYEDIVQFNDDMDKLATTIEKRDVEGYGSRALDSVFDYRTTFGNVINTPTSLEDFLTGTDGHPEPDKNDTDHPTLLSVTQFDATKDFHDTLDTWEPKDLDGDGKKDIRVVQVAGTGRDETVYGVEYKVDDENIGACRDNDINTCIDLPGVYPYPLTTTDGDGTVMLGSATAMDVNTVFFDLRNYNAHRKESYNDTIDRQHVNIMGAKPIQFLIDSIVEHYNLVNPYLASTTPTSTPYWRIEMHSPVHIEAYDTNGDHTGRAAYGDITVVDENIPNSAYVEIGDRSYMFLPQDETEQINLQGLASGTFTLTLTKYDNTTEISSVEFADLPATNNMEGAITISPTTTEPVLALDYNADGVVDINVVPGEEISDSDTFTILRSIISTLELSDKKQRRLLRVVDRIERVLARESRCDNKKKEKQQEHCEDRLETRANNVFDRLIGRIEKFRDKGNIDADDAEELITVVREIQGKVIQ